MPMLQPPITGDAQLDSWTLRLTQSINSGLLPGIGGGTVHGETDSGGGGLPGTPGNSVLYLFQRTLDEDLIPVAPQLVDYDFSDLANPIVNASDGWTRDIPVEDDDFYIWVTFRYISELVDTIADANSWDTPVRLSSPTISYAMATSGYNFIRVEVPTVDINATVLRYAGEIARDITPNLTSDHVKWTKRSLGAVIPNPATPEWDAATPYVEGDIVRREISLMAQADATYPGPTMLPIMFEYEYVNTIAGTGMDPADGIGWEFTEGSRIKNLDEIWDVTLGWTSGTTITVDETEVIIQTEFRVQLRDDIADVPRR